MIVARRGTDIPYAQDGTELNPMIRHLLARMSWDEVKEKGLLLDGETDPCSHL